MTVVQTTAAIMEAAMTEAVTPVAIVAVIWEWATTATVAVIWEQAIPTAVLQGK